METLAWILLIGSTVGGGIWYLILACLTGKGIVAKVLLPICGSAVFLIAFFVSNHLIDNNMPDWFLRFINTHGDPAGFCLVIVALAVLNFFAPLLFIRRSKEKSLASETVFPQDRPRAIQSDNFQSPLHEVPVSSSVTIPKSAQITPTPYLFWLKYLLITMFGMMFISILTGTLWWFFWERKVDLETYTYPERHITIMLSFFCGFINASFVAGVLWVLLRRIARVFNWWVPAAILAWIISWGSQEILNLDFLSFIPLGIRVSLMYLSIGASFGLLTWLIIGRVAYHSGWWILVQIIISMALLGIFYFADLDALLLGNLADNTIISKYPLPLYWLTSIVRHIILNACRGLIIGGISGVTLSLLLRHRKDVRAPSTAPVWLAPGGSDAPLVLPPAVYGARPISKGFYMGSVVTAAVLSWLFALITIVAVQGEANDSSSLLIFILLVQFLSFCVLIYTVIIGAFLWHKAWQVIQDGHARTTPGRAVGFAFIPIFNLYWAFQLIYGFAKDYNAYRRRYNIPVAALSEGYFLAATILMIPGIIISRIPYVGIVYALIAGIVGIILLNSVCNAVNSLVGFRASRETAVANAEQGQDRV